LNFLINVEEDGGSKSQVTVGTYGKGDAFGESALILGPHPTTITTITDCELWSIERQTYRCVISQLHYNQHEEKMAFFRECELNERAFTEIFDSAQIEDLALAAKNDSFDEGTPIIREGEPSDVFYFVRSGFVNTYKKGINPGLGDLAFTIPAKRAFGTTTLLKGTVSPYSYVAKTKVRVYYITKDSFELMLGTLQNALDGNTISRSVTREQSRKTFKDATTMIADRIHDHLELKDLTFYNMLGRGAFGRVTLVQSKQDKALFALKSQQKHYIVSKKQQEHVLNEYKIMKTIGHDPNILGIHNVMQNERYLYFLVDLLPGGELMDYLKRDRKFPESTAKFYSASVILAFERLHSESIAYRDLKPENIVLDKDGYGVLVDFGLAKQIEEGQTYTLCGTPDYFAPEIIQSLGHDWGVDYWELGIFLFETVCGRAPFYDRSLTRRYKKILKGYSYVNVPSGLLCEALGDLISHLLVADQSKRLGRIRDGIQGIKSHRFFAGFDWEGLQERRIPPPFKPSLPQDIKTLGKKNCSTFDDSMVPMSDWNPDLKTLEGWL
jgi:cGMP-dependent protein kinase